MKRTVDVVIPDLGLHGMPQRITVWHVRAGQRVVEGDRLLEIAADHVVFDLPAPASGTLCRRLVAEEEAVTAGQVVGRLECSG